MYSFVKSTMISMAAMLAVIGVASAADLPTKKGAPPAPTAVAPFNWSGLYAGINAGITAPNSSLNNSVYGGLIGVDAGYNYQYGPYVLGVEASSSYAKIKQFNQPTVALTDADLVAGYSLGGLLPYVKGGAAYATDWNNRLGWNLGAGVKYAVSYNVDVFGEYDYYDLGKNGGNKLTTSVVKAGVEYKF